MSESSLPRRDPKYKTVANSDALSGPCLLERMVVLVTKNRLQIALVCLALLALVGVLTLDGRFRLVVCIFLGGLAVKSWIAYLRERAESESRGPGGPPYVEGG